VTTSKATEYNRPIVCRTQNDRNGRLLSVWITYPLLPRRKLGYMKTQITNFPVRQNLHQILAIAAFNLLTNISVPVLAQIVPDRTLPERSIVTPDGTSIEIQGGTRAGDNLFHSFEQFSVPTGSEAFFNNTLSVENIISRVTGGQVSNIDGLIRANGSANLFLLNPNGILFGPNAALNIGGSFVGSTADSLRFNDAREFSAAEPQTSLLTISVPMGLQYGTNPGDINVQGNGNNVFLDGPFVIRVFRPDGLRVADGQTLALIGGNVALDGGNLTAFDGRIELGSVGSDAFVQLAATDPGFRLNYGDVSQFQDIALSRAASVEASGNSGGSIEVQGRRVTLTEGSTLFADTLGNGTGGTLRITASEFVGLAGTSSFTPPPTETETFPEFPFSSRLSTDVGRFPGSTGKGGTLEIETDRLVVTDGAQISSGTFSTGNSGTLRIVAREIVLNGGAAGIGPSGLFVPVAPDARGNGGVLIVEAGQLQVTNGARILGSTFGLGDAGTLNVRAEAIDLDGTSPGGSSSGLFVNVELGAEGNGGRLFVDAERVQVTNGAQIASLTFGAGNAGELAVRATDIELIGASPNGLPSSFLAAVERGATGNAGNLSIDTARLRLTDGAQIAVSTEDVGNSGTLTVRADKIEIIGTSEFGRSGLFASAIAGTGNGGDVNINANSLHLENGATISTSNFQSQNLAPPGRGAAGDVRLDAPDLRLEDRAIVSAEVNAGDRGNVLIQSEDLRMGGNSQITTNARGTATGGNIEIDTNTLVALDNSDITANSISSFGGRVEIDADSLFGIEFRDAQTANSDITATSELGPAFSGVVEIDTPDVETTVRLVSLPENVINIERLIAQRCPIDRDSEFYITGRGGLPPNPREPLPSGLGWQDWRNLEELSRQLSEETARSSEVGTRQSHPQPPNTPPLIESAATLIEATGSITMADGTVMLVADTPRPLFQRFWSIPASCYVR